jgi:hypothetical protein
MKIDSRVEQLVRDTLHWAVKQRPEELDAALAAFPDQATRLAALELLVAIDGFVLLDLFNGVKPNDAQLRAVAEKLAELEAWSTLSADEIDTYLTAVLTGTPLATVLPARIAVALAFIVTASLLSSRPKQGDEWWFDYLDRVEAVIEAADTASNSSAVAAVSNTPAGDLWS